MLQHTEPADAGIHPVNDHSHHHVSIVHQICLQQPPLLSAAHFIVLFVVCGSAVSTSQL